MSKRNSARGGDDSCDAAAASVKQYVIDGKKFTVVRHFADEKNIRRVVWEIAVERAENDAETKRS